MTAGGMFIRIIAVLLLSVPVILSFGYYVGAKAIEDTFLDPSVLINFLDEDDAYDLAYEGIFLSPVLEEQTNLLVGSFSMSDPDKERLLRQIIPLEDIRVATRRSITSITAFLNSDSEEFEVFIDLSPHIGKIEPTVMAFINEKIEVMEPNTVSDAEELALQIESFLRTIADGRIPSRLPFLNAVPASPRSRAYRQATASLSQDPSIHEDANASLRVREADVIAALNAGDVEAGLKLAAEAVAAPRIDQAIVELREDLNEMGHLNLVDRVVEETDLTREEVIEDSADLRSLVRGVTGAGPVVALVLMALFTIAIGLIFIPHRRHIFFWPSASVLVIGLIFLALGWLLTLNAPWASGLCDTADTSCTLGVNLVQDIVSNIGGSFIKPSIIVLIIGAIGALPSVLIPHR